MGPNPILKKLGFKDDDRVVILHADDIGMCQSSITAFEELHQFGLVKSGAVMVPCSWFPAVIDFTQRYRDADLGVHLTITSEWSRYRWGPISTRNPNSGMIDEEGYFYRTAEDVQKNGKVDAVTREIEAQIVRAFESGWQPTHADTHMGAVAHIKFMKMYIQLAIKYNVPPMMLRLDEEGWRNINATNRGANLDEIAVQTATQLVQSLEAMGVPLLDSITGLPLDADPANRLEDAKAALDKVQPGITHFVIHPSVDTPELRAIAPDWACRVADYKTFQRDELRQYIESIGVHVIGYRPLMEIMQTNGG